MGTDFCEQRGQPSHDRTRARSLAVFDPASLVVGATAAQVIGGLVTQMSPLVIGGLIAGLSVSGRAARRKLHRALLFTKLMTETIRP